ncbi:AraC family transcriptional regulator [Polaromonas sp. A23]|uniref:helix-turn-helix domain-containing protein n=1 Tax=Polaromonas sp. A23 TaxID=1944133 RepID=UPI000985DDA0|nr:AraC family transcriptional regulator [Polaromonas sp. A23]OOG39964.1 AraC family transcriptional regulator [Polaromonas sp. A23]
MPPPENDFAATARVIAPTTPLASCVRAYVIRNTTGRTPLPPAQRLNRFPASPMCSISWIIQGEVMALETGLPTPRAALGGPQTQPRVSQNPGPVHVFIVLFFPQALHALTGLDMSRQVDRFVALGDVLDGPWLALSQQVLAAADDATRVALIANFLEPRWQAARSAGAAPGSVLGDWVNSLAIHVAASGWGRSARNIERRIKIWAGQPLRVLRRYRRAERSLLESRADLEAGTVSWAEAAAQGGYADQPHLSREVRAITGLPPGELARRIRDDESYWVYQIWS